MWDWFMAHGVWILVAVIIGSVLFMALRRWTERVLKRFTPRPLYKQLEANRKLISRVITCLGTLIILLGIAAVAVSTLGGDITPLLAAVGLWLGEHGVRILIIAGIAYLFYRLVSALTPWFISGSIKAQGKGRRAKVELEKRIKTLSRIISQLVAALVVVIALFMVLTEVGINVTAAIAGLGIVGVAVGFGAQYLVSDLIAGFFVFLENQYNVGDVIKVGDVNGGVEEISLRRTILRDLHGARHIIPHGQVKILTNLTQEWSRANIVVSVAYKEDLDRVMALMKETWEEMARDEKWGPLIKAKTPFLVRVEEFGDSGINIKLVGETEPVSQWDVMGEFRRRIKKVFDEAGVEIPWPHVKLYLGDDEVKKRLSR